MIGSADIRSEIVKRSVEAERLLEVHTPDEPVPVGERRCSGEAGFCAQSGGRWGDWSGSLQEKRGKQILVLENKARVKIKRTHDK